MSAGNLPVVFPRPVQYTEDSSLSKAVADLTRGDVGCGCTANAKPTENRRIKQLFFLSFTDSASVTGPHRLVGVEPTAFKTLAFWKQPALTRVTPAPSHLSFKAQPPAACRARIDSTKQVL